MIVMEPTEMKKRPALTIDPNRLLNLERINEWVDFNGMKTKAGNLKFLPEWRSALDQAFINLSGVMDKDLADKIDGTFKEIEKIYPIGISGVPSSRTNVNIVIMKLQELNIIFSRVLNWLTIVGVEG